MGFVRFACILLVVLPLTSLSIMKFHQEDKHGAEDSFTSLEKELLGNNIGERKLGVQELNELESSKNLGGGSKEKISSMDLSSSFNGENNGKKKKKIIISKFGIRKKLGSGSELVYSNADYLTHMHHPPRHN